MSASLAHRARPRPHRVRRVALVLFASLATTAAAPSAVALPPTLAWHTFLGTSADDSGHGVAVDASGDVYVTGTSDATWGTPVRPFSGSLDNVFVAKLDASGALVWNTFLGSGSDLGLAIAVDASGNVYVTGTSHATWGSPVRAFSPGLFPSFGDAFVAKLDANGVLLWNSFLGSGSDDVGFGVAVDALGSTYLTGTSAGTWGSPVRAFASRNDAFAAKLDANGALVWNTFLGGGREETGNGIASGASGNVYVVGEGDATWGTPVRAFSGGRDAFAAALAADGALLWNTFLGGGGGRSIDDRALGVAVDASGSVYLTGGSEPAWGSPVEGHHGAEDVFAAKLAADGVLVWNTFLGGADTDAGHGIALDASGALHLAGESNATWGSPVREHGGGINDGFAAQLAADGALLWHTFLGGTGGDLAEAIAVDAGGNTYVNGLGGPWGNPLRGHGGGTRDAFLAKLAPPSADLAISKDDGVTTVVPGGVTTYTIVVSNPAGPAAVTGATVADVFPAACASVDYTSSVTGGAAGNTAVGSGDVADTVDLPVGSSITYTATCTIEPAAGGTLANTATIAPPAGITDPEPANDSATDIDVLTVAPGFAVAFSAGAAGVGEPVFKSFTIANPNPIPLTGLAFDDTFPAGLEVAAAGVESDSCGFTSGLPSPGDTGLSPAGGTVGANGSCVLRIAVVATLPGSLANDASPVSSNEAPASAAPATAALLAEQSVVEVPTLSTFALLLLVAALGATGLWRLRVGP